MIKKIKGFLWQKKWWLALFLVVGGIGAIIINRQGNKPETVTVRPEYRSITQTLNVSGTVDADQKARLNFAAASKLVWLPIKEGDVVKKWQGLAQVDARTLNNQLQIALNNHGKQFRAFENTLDAVDYYGDDGLTNSQRRTAESAQLDIRNTALAAESASIAVEQALMVSPIEGVVTRIDQKIVGAMMLPSDTIEVINPKSIYFSAIVDEEDIPRISASQSAKIRLDAFEGQEFDSKVMKIAFTPSISESGGTGYKVWFSLPANNSSMQYKLGMNGEADVVLDHKDNVLSIPVDALVEREGKKYVDVKRNGKIERVEVEIGIQDSLFVEITNGLTVDDEVVIPTS